MTLAQLTSRLALVYIDRRSLFQHLRNVEMSRKQSHYGQISSKLDEALLYPPNVTPPHSTSGSYYTSSGGTLMLAKAIVLILPISPPSHLLLLDLITLR